MAFSLVSMLLVLLVLTSGTVRPDDTFTTKLFDEFGYSFNGSLRLSEKNVTLIAASIVSGETVYDQSKTVQQNSSGSPTQVSRKCVSLLEEDISAITQDSFSKICPRILYSLTQDCVKSSDNKKHEDNHKHDKPFESAVWGYGFLFVTVINLCSLAGIAVLPLMKKDFYTTLLMFLVGLAVGSLCANGILCLIPEAFEIQEMEGYVWKALCMVGGIYLFFITERILKIVTKYCTKSGTAEIGNNTPAESVPTFPLQTYVEINRLPLVQTDDSQEQLTPTEHNGKFQRVNSNGDDSPDHNDLADSGECFDKLDSCHLNSSISRRSEKQPVKTIAWMITIGDAFHNFIDGLSIGAAFSKSTLLGISISIAVLCEELPHELGDFVLLLRSGMSKKRALLFNFLSASTCYLGLVVGISLSEVGHATPWILSIAGGMFLYISLADMMPELNHAAEEHSDRPIKVFVIQNLGLLAGFTVILLVTLYGSQIRFGS